MWFLCIESDLTLQAKTDQPLRRNEVRLRLKQHSFRILFICIKSLLNILEQFKYEILISKNDCFEIVSIIVLIIE